MVYQIHWRQIFLLKLENVKSFVYFFLVILLQNLKTLAPSGYVDVYPRKVDLENVKKLKNFNDVDVVMSFKKLEEKNSKEN